MTLIGVAAGTWILVGAVLVGLGGVVYGFFTVAGSGIEHHPHDGDDGAPGAKGPSEASGKDEGEGSALETHGTR